MSGEQLGSPVAAILARRDSRPAMPERLKEPEPDDSSDEDWDLDEDEGEERMAAMQVLMVKGGG